MKVLVLETNLMWVSRLKLSITALGHEPVFGSILPADLNGYGLAILNLAGPSGLEETVARLKEANIPIIAHAGHKEKELMELGASLGIDILASNSEMTNSLGKVLERVVRTA